MPFAVVKMVDGAENDVIMYKDGEKSNWTNISTALNELESEGYLLVSTVSLSGVSHINSGDDIFPCVQYTFKSM